MFIRFVLAVGAVIALMWVGIQIAEQTNETAGMQSSVSMEVAA